MAKIEGLHKVVARLRAMAAKSRKDQDVSVSVGYGTNYALTVHEDMNAYHPVGQAKYLEQPAREKEREIADIVTKNLLKKRTMAESLLLGGLFLQRESQLLVPVDTAALKNSAFTKLDE